MTHRRLRLLVVTAAGLLAGVTPLAAQRPWAASYYPYVVKGPNEKLSLVLHYQYAQSADYDQRVPFMRTFVAEAGANADGGRFAVGRFKGPLLADGWRLFVEGGVVRQSRFGYFGLGNDTKPTATKLEPLIDKMRRVRSYARVDVTRRLAGPLQFSLGGGLTHASYSRLPGPTRFAADCSLPPNFGDLPPPPLSQVTQGCTGGTDLIGRASLILDTRDNELVTARGVLLEGGLIGGTAGDGYGGIYGLAEGFVSPREGTVFGARILGRHLGSGATLEARTDLFAWERTIPLVGGPESHRAFLLGRYTGRDVILGNLEARQDILNFGDYGAITALGFLDAGQARERLPGESRKFHVGGGAGLALRLLRSTVLTFNWAWSADGYQFSMGTGWAF
jgi:hypothetical protein